MVVVTCVQLYLSTLSSTGTDVCLVYPPPFPPPLVVLQSAALQHFSGYAESSMRACLVDMHAILAAAPAAQLQAVRKKYAQPRYSSVTTLPLPSL